VATSNKISQGALQALSDRQAGSEEMADLEQEELIADSVGLALMVIVEKLTPAERVAFVLHDVFDVPFEEISRSSEKDREGKNVGMGTALNQRHLRRSQPTRDAALKDACSQLLQRPCR
jgi:hypothetical protein